MDFANSLLELVKQLWGLASKPLGYIYNLKDHVQSLRSETDSLKAVIEDVKARVELEEGGGGVRHTKQVENWLDKVEEFVGGAEQVLREAREHDRIKCLGRFLPWNCKSSYRLGKRVDRRLNEARELQQKKGEFSEFTALLPPPPVLELPRDETVGHDSSLNKVLKWLMHEKLVGVIGLYGTGGVGKTTLMKRIEEELSHANHEFEVVIWVMVSKQVNEDGIRDVIRKGLDIQDERWDEWSRDERVHHLWAGLKRKKYVLLIDDLRGRLDLSKIGVPHPNLRNGSKIVFTTRSKHVCDHMAVDKSFEVQCLMLEEALELFENSVGKSIVHAHPEILEHAKDIAGECKGLPLALVTVGRAMAGRTNPHAWKHALKTLKDNPHKLSGMVEEVYYILEFSYSSLNDSTQRCFLYCCLFPEDYLIRPCNLIELWAGEGLLGETNDVYSMRDNGENVLDSLKMACLLESGLDVNGRSYVKLHDVIHGFATWIACDRGQKENKLLVIEKAEDMSGVMISKWGEAEKVSVWGGRIASIDRTPSQCSQLETLLVRETKVSLVPRGFFDSMKAHLTVLDLSGNTLILFFPEGICDLIYLQYLNLSATRIKELPWEIKNLTCLRWLLLDNMHEEILIPTGAIANLPLNVFSCWIETIYVPRRILAREKEEEIIEGLECMQHLPNLSISVHKTSSALKIFESPNLQRSIRRARINHCEGLTGILISHSSTGNNGGFPHLEVLDLYNCSMLKKMEISQGIGRAPNCSCFPSLVQVVIYKCGLLDLSWLVHAPKLQELRVDECRSMERIIWGEFTRAELATSGLFSRLETLTLVNLPFLRSICDQTLVFPQEVSFAITGCPGLIKLPLDSNSARGRSFSVEGDLRWWVEFEWEPTARVTVRWPGRSLVEEMEYADAVLQMKTWWLRRVKIVLLTRGAN